MTSPQPRRLLPGTRGRQRQRGATLIVAVIVLMLITMTVISAFRVSRSHTQSVANMQFRDEALAAANLVLEDVVSLPNVETLVLANGTVAARSVDINQDGVDDFQVALAVPRCIRVETGGTDEAGQLNGVLGEVENNGLRYVLWEVRADVTDAATGAEVSVVQGFRQQVSAEPASCNN